MRYCHPKTLLSASYHVLFVTASCRLGKCWRRVLYWRHRDFLRNALPKRYTNHVHRTVTEVDTTRRIKTLWKRISPHRRKWEVAPATTSSQGKMICRGRHCCAVRSLYCSLSELCTLWFACTPPCKALRFQRDHSKSTVSSPLPTPLDIFQQTQGQNVCEIGFCLATILRFLRLGSPIGLTANFAPTRALR